MLYKRKGDILTSADDKLCSSCCPCPESFTITFSDVIECPDLNEMASWPALDLNDYEFSISKTGTEVGACCYQGTAGGWYISLKFYNATKLFNLCAWYACEGECCFDGGAIAFVAEDVPLPYEDFSNMLVEADCCDNLITVLNMCDSHQPKEHGMQTGYDGTATIAIP